MKNNCCDEVDYSKYNELEKVYDIFSKLKINNDIIDENRVIGSLSGGEKVKIQLTKILLANPDVLLLDEPTNDLDLGTLLWLENFVKNSNKAIIYISHDETFLENTANVIVHLEQIKKKTECRHTIAKTGYKEYIENRLQLIDRQNSIADKEKQEFDIKMDKWRKIYQRVDYQQKTITRQDPHGGQLLKKKMHSVKSQQKMLEKEKDRLAKKVDVEDSIGFEFKYNVDIPKNKVIYNKVISPLVIGDKVLSKRIKLTIKGGNHIVIVGDNGCGKTTLLKRIYEEIKDNNYKVGYMSQNYDDELDVNSNVVEFICANKEKGQITLGRTFLGSMKFTEDEMDGKISQLSGGQKAKLLLIKLIMDKCQVLVLDEPTRNLSPLSNPVIRKMLREYQGCIISVSHDRKYIEDVGAVVYKLDKEGVHEI